ncbi:MAG: TM2 domain-containing protein [Burkholderiales bacterium]|nr:TM2 domain-containing protein [Burkholderiales bacterium]
MPDLDNNTKTENESVVDEGQVDKQVAVEMRLAKEKKSETIAYILWLCCLPVATLGLQNFYVGRTKLGWLELCCTGIAVLFGIAFTYFFFGDNQVGTVLFGPLLAIFAVIVIACWIWDLFTLPTAITHHTSKLRDKIAKEFEMATSKLTKEQQQK